MTTAAPLADAEAQITATLRRFSKGIITFNSELLVSTLDPESGALIYQPEERPDALQTREEVERYVDSLHRVIGGFSDTRTVETRIDVVGDFAHVYVRFWCRIHRVDGDPIDGQVRQTFVLRRHDEEWYVRHYHESRQIPGFPVIEVKEMP